MLRPSTSVSICVQVRRRAYHVIIIQLTIQRNFSGANTTGYTDMCLFKRDVVLERPIFFYIDQMGLKDVCLSRVVVTLGTEV